MKKTIIVITAIFIAMNPAHSSKIGQVLFLKGDYRLVSVLSGERTKIKMGTSLFAGQRVLTNDNTFVEIHLNDKTEILIYSNTSIQFIGIRKKKYDHATSIIVDYGMVTIKKGSRFNDKSIEVETSTAIIKGVKAHFSLIVGLSETRMLVTRGSMGIVSNNYKNRYGYLVKQGEEISIKKNNQPDPPVKSHTWFSELWLKKYKIVNRNYIIKRMQ